MTTADKVLTSGIRTIGQTGAARTTVDGATASQRVCPEFAATVVDLLLWRAADTADRIAYVYSDGVSGEQILVTYGKLDERARVIAAQLHSLARADRPVLLVYPPGIEFVVAFFGCLYAGLIAVPRFAPSR